MDQRDSGEKRNKLVRGCYLILLLRWFFLVCIALEYAFIEEKILGTAAFTVSMVVIAFFNLIVSRNIVKNSNKNKSVAVRYSKIYFYIDVVILSFFIYVMGGVNSDIYILLFFVIGYCGMFGNVASMVKLSVFAVAVYTLSCILSSKYYIEGISYWKLIFKDFFLMLASLGISLIDSEMKRYNEMHKREFKMARTDKLTGLANRHYFDQKLYTEIEYSDCTGTPLNVLIFDLDNFKKFNDAYGHVWGDKLLTLFSDIIKQNIRKTDIPVRFGGEEFLLLIRELDIEIAKSVGERIRKQLEKQRIYIDTGSERLKVTVSCGLAQYPRHSSDIKTVIEFADKALYHAKEIGKNIVVTYDEIGKVNRMV